MYIEDTVRMNLLYDFYGGLLTVKQREIVRMYYGDDMSLAEIAVNVNISRQGVHDALRKAAAALEGYERKLGLVGKFRSAEKAVGMARDEIDRLAAERGGDAALAGRLRGIRDMIERIEV
jgi:predicted DNA-binding protein YlxM (UPF0122 family)